MVVRRRTRMIKKKKGKFGKGKAEPLKLYNSQIMRNFFRKKAPGEGHWEGKRNREGNG